MASPHVPLPRALRLPPEFAAVPAYLALHDPDLRVRRSVERPGTFVLERRCRRRPAIHTGLTDASDIHVQARDGYIHVARVHPSWLLKPWNIVRELQATGEDLWVKGARRVTDELEYEAAWAEENRRRRRREEFRQLGLTLYDELDRRGGHGGTERFRISNPGLPAGAGKSAAHTAALKKKFAKARRRAARERPLRVH